MQRQSVRVMSCLSVLLLFALVSCAPAAPPSPTAAPAKPAAQPTAVPAKPPEPPAAKPASTTAPAKTEAKPAASPVVKAEAKPAASPAAKAEAKPAASPAAKAAFDEKAVADFYRGKTVRVIVGFTPGGGFDAYARAIFRHIGKHIPGNPTTVVENMPGAGSRVATNHVYNAAPKDGTVVGLFSGASVGQQLFGAPGVEFDAAKFHYLGVPVQDTAVLHIHKRTGITRVDELIGPNAKELILGGSAPGSMNVDAPNLLRDVMGANIKLVQGYPGSAQVKLAIDKGELDGSFNGWESVKLTNLAEVESGEWMILVQLTESRHKDLPNVAAIPDFAKTEEQRQLLLFGQAYPNQFNRPFVLPPGVPQDRVIALREAFARTMTDTEYLADTDKAKLLRDPLSGEEVQKRIERFMAMSADLKAKLQKILVGA